MGSTEDKNPPASTGSVSIGSVSTGSVSTSPVETPGATPIENPIVVQSTRFGPMELSADSVIHFPKGLVGFPDGKSYVMFEHKPPFAWLHSTTDPDLAFVVMDGSHFLGQFDLKAPFGDSDLDLKEEDEYAILVVVTVRGDPTLTTANVKAPLFVNLRNRRGTQVIYDDPSFPTRFALYKKSEGEEK